MLSDDKFYERAKDFVLLKSVEGKLYTLTEYTEHIQANQQDKDGNTVVLYTTDAEQQHGFVAAAQERGYDVLNMDQVLDAHFIGQLEQKLEKTSFKRVDAATASQLIEKDDAQTSVLSEDDQKKLEEVFTGAISNPAMHVKVAPLSPQDAPVVITQNEFMRRMKDMQRTGGGGGMQMFGSMPDSFDVTVNANSPLVSKVLADGGETIAKQAFDLALLAQGMLKGEALTAFVKRSTELL
jgi:molecular chaperone HtpG